MTVVQDPSPTPSATDSPTVPACVMSFNASDPTGAGGLAGDIATISAMGAYALPVVTAIVLRDTAETFEACEVDPETVVEQARSVLEDIGLSAWKVGFLGSAEGVSAVAEVLADYADVPLVAYLNNLSWMADDQLQSYWDAFRELILPQTTVLIGNHQTLVDFLLPDWEAERPPSARELAAAAQDFGTENVLVTGLVSASSPTETLVENVLAGAREGAIKGEKFERLDATFVGAGETLSAAVTALLASGIDLHLAVSEALGFLDQALEAGFQPGMGGLVPDRFFWALPSEEDDAADASEQPAAQEAEAPSSRGKPRRVH